MKNKSLKLFSALVMKELRHVIRDRKSLLILIGLPIIMMLIFGFALSNELKNANIAVINYAQDEASSLLLDRIDQSDYFNIVKSADNTENIEKWFKEGSVLLGMVIPENFEQKITKGEKANIQVIADGIDPNTATTALNYLQLIILQFEKDRLPPYQAPMTIKVENSMLYNPQLKSTFNFVPGVLTLILMLLGAMMTSVSIVKEKEIGTMEVLLVSPMKPLMLVISKAVPYLILCLIDVIIILILAYTILGMPMRGNLFLLLAESTLFIITTLALGLLISTKVGTQQVAMFLSLVGFLMPALVFSGFMFPIENMPVVLQVISNAVPTRWFYEIIKNVMVKGLGFQFVIKETLILVGMTVFFIALALKSFKIRLQ